MTVSPPPGVSSNARRPPIAATKPWAIGQAEPDAVAAALVAEALERFEDLRRRSCGDARPVVDDAQVDLVAQSRRVDSAPGRRRAG